VVVYYGWNDPLHRSYSEVVRDVAKASSSFLLDLESEYDASQALGQIFLDDAIHFTRFGLALVAKDLAERVRGEILPSPPGRKPARAATGASGERPARR
jgi:hypothetical protein